MFEQDRDHIEWERESRRKTEWNRKGCRQRRGRKKSNKDVAICNKSGVVLLSMWDGESF